MRGHDLPIDTMAAQLPEIIECHAVTGDDCHIVKVLAPSVTELAQTIASLTRCGVTSTSIVLSSSVGRKAIKPAS